jgi:periplasmic protein TonB
METNRSRQLKAVGTSVLIHGMLLMVFLYAHSSPKLDVCMVVPIDESQVPFPMYEETVPPGGLKQSAALAKPAPGEQGPAPVEPAGLEKENTDPEPRADLVETKKVIEPPSDEESRLEPVRMQTEVLASFTRMPAGEGRGISLSIDMPNGGNSGGGSARYQGISGNSVSGRSGAGQGNGDDGGSAIFGSPTGPRFLRRKMPEYPIAARKQKKEGKVVLAITIDAYGSLQDIEVMEASDPLFVQPSIAALRKSSFLPASRRGVPIAIKAILPIRFALEN